MCFWCGENKKHGNYDDDLRFEVLIYTPSYLVCHYNMIDPMGILVHFAILTFLLSTLGYNRDNYVDLLITMDTLKNTQQYPHF